MKKLFQQFGIENDESIENLLLMRKQVFQTTGELLEARNKIRKNAQLEPFSIGTYLGSEGKRGFTPSFPLIDAIAQKTQQKITIDEKGAWLFLCGRDLLGSSILQAPLELKKNDLVIIQNEAQETLGYGKITDHLNKKDKIVVQNIIDRGDFLRREKR